LRAVPEFERPETPASRKIWAICCWVVSRPAAATMEKSAVSAVSVTVRVTEVDKPSVSWAKEMKAESKSRVKSLIYPDCGTNGLPVCGAGWQGYPLGPADWQSASCAGKQPARRFPTCPTNTGESPHSYRKAAMGSR